MKRDMRVLVFLLLTCSLQPTAYGLIPPDRLLDAIEWVESGGRGKETPDGDMGRSVGPYQIQLDYLADANAWLGTDFTHQEMRDPAKARFVVCGYLDRYGQHYERSVGRVATLEVLARIHNGGPNGWQKKATVNYWKRVEARMRATADERR